MEVILRHPVLCGAAAAVTAVGTLYRILTHISVQGTDLQNKYVVITGGNRGIGREIVRHLAKHNANVIIGCRDVALGHVLIKELQASGSQGEFHCFKLDLASFKSVREFADKVLGLNKPITYLLNNAGMMEPDGTRKSEDGFPYMYQVNHLSHFLLTQLLLENMAKATAFDDKCQGRIINLSSYAAYSGQCDLDLWSEQKLRHGFQGFSGYADTKLMNIMFTRELNRRLKDQNIISVSIHPGFVYSDFFYTMPLLIRIAMRPALWVVGRSETQGAVTPLYTVYDAKIEGGAFYYSNRHAKLPPAATDEVAMKKFWDLSVLQCQFSK